MHETDQVKLIAIKTSKNNNLLIADVSVRVKSNTKKISYRFSWIDNNNLQVYGDEAWKPMPIHVGQSGSIQGFAPGPAAVDFVFELFED